MLQSERSSRCTESAEELQIAALHDWWQPTVEGFWQRLPKSGMVHAMSEAKVTAAAPLDSMKKAEAAQMVSKAMQGGAWLPVPLRPVESAGVDGCQLAQAA